MATKAAPRPASQPRVRDLDRGIAMAAAATEYQRVLAQLETLQPGQWTLPTGCPGWDVRAVAGHNLGMAQMLATMMELGRQQMAAQRGAKKTGAVMIDVLTALQVTRNAALTTAGLIELMRAAGPKAARSRRRMPAIVRHRAMPGAQLVGGVEERWTFGFLFDVVLTRDAFMHRLDIARAAGLPIESSAGHEGVLVDDVVREWAARHGRPYRLALSGTAGGTWGSGDGERIAMDAFDFCRVVSGRGSATGLLSQQVPF